MENGKGVRAPLLFAKKRTHFGYGIFPIFFISTIMSNQKDGKLLPNIGWYPDKIKKVSPQLTHVNDFLTTIQRGDYRNKINPLRESLAAAAGFVEAAAKAAATGDTVAAETAQAAATAATAAASQQKGVLPIVTVSGIFPPGQRKAAKIVSHSGFVVMDFDGDKGQPYSARCAWAVGAKNKLMGDPYVYSVFYSCSGLGLAALVKIKADAKTHKAHFDWLVRYYEEKLGLAVDTSGSDVSRPRYVSYDPALYYNEGSDEVPEVAPPQPAPANKAPTAGGVLAAVGKPVGRAKLTPEETRNRTFAAVGWITEHKIDIAPDYETWLKFAFAFRTTWGEDGKLLFLQAVSFSKLFNAADSAKKYDSLGAGDAPKNPVTIGTFLKKYSDARKAKKKEGDENALPICEQLVSHIMAVHPDWGLNTLKYILVDGVGTMVDRGLKRDVLNAVAKAAGRDNIAASLLDEAVFGTPMPRYDPVLRALERQSKKERDPEALDKLFGQYGYEDDISPVFLKKWYASFFETYFNPGDSKLSVVLTGRGDLGKSKLIQNLFPDELSEYTVTTTLEGDQDDIGETFGENLLVLIDEVDDLPYYARKRVKELVSREIFYYDVKYQAGKRRSMKRCLIAFTTNDFAFLTDGGENNRYMFVRMVSRGLSNKEIKDLFLKQDREECFYQAYLLWKAGGHILTEEERALMKESGADFVVETAVGAGIKKHFVPGSPGGTGSEFLSASEVIDILKSVGVDAKMYSNGVGRELQSWGYDKKQMRCGSQWTCGGCTASVSKDPECNVRKKGYWVRRVTGVNVPAVGLADPNTGGSSSFVFPNGVMPG